MASNFTLKTLTVHVGPRGQGQGQETVELTLKVADNFFDNGTFGYLYHAYLVPSGEKVAIKRVIQDPTFRNRELDMIKSLSHPHIVELKYYYLETLGDDKFLNLIMKCENETLYRVIRRLNKRGRLTPMMFIRAVMFQLFRALAYVHSFGICHRDIKPHNILMDTERAVVKLCDFGSAKRLNSGDRNVFYICSRFYRAPDLMFGRDDYGCEVDMWAAGCVMGEMFLTRVLFLGDNRADQLAQIMNILGTPTRADMSAMNADYDDLRLPEVARKPWSDVFPREVPADAQSLLNGLLRFQPAQRITAFQALANDFFDSLRDPESRLPSDQRLPQLFEWTAQEINNMPAAVKQKVVRNGDRIWDGNSY